MMSENKVLLTVDSAPHDLAILLRDLRLVDEFNAEQKAITVVVEPELKVIVRRPFYHYHYHYNQELQEVTFIFSDVVPSEPTIGFAVDAMILVSMILWSFEDHLEVNALKLLRSNQQVWLDIPKDVDAESYLLANSAIEWRGIINEDWEELCS
jgi:hypothetical protein